MAIEEITYIRIEDSADRTTVTRQIEFYVLIDLRSKSWYQYKTLSDTAQISKSGMIQGELPGFGWSFYLNAVNMESQPQVLSDTIKDKVKYLRIKFTKLNKRFANYDIGYLRYDNKGKLFSYEKVFSYKVNCSMTRDEDYQEGAVKPFVMNELKFLSDTLSLEELRIFDTWKKNELGSPTK